MNKVLVELECGCFRKSEFQKESTHNSKEEAKKYADELVDFMNTRTCGKHTFSLSQDGENYVVNVQLSDN